MPDQVIFSEPYGAVLIDASVPCIISQWHTFANKQEFRTLLEAAMVYFDAHSSQAKPWGWIADSRHMGAIPAEVQQWLHAVFNQRIAKAGLREMSVVVPETIFGKMAVQQYKQNIEQKPTTYELQTRYYNSLESAKDGIRQYLGQR
ncbi:hypothetical protein [Hymenobacter bucti]|uniref:Uncharacterized protein n=1 Tax=Hymenobacter bucti TaxID=1844114 RepID=A0ABW4QZA7_9BACT